MDLAGDSHLPSQFVPRSKDVPVEHLEQEKRDGGDRVEHTVSPAISSLSSGETNGVGTEDLREVLAQSR